VVATKDKMNIHEHHRSRLRAKFLKDADVLEEHEALEILLYSSQKRVNTNPIARRLIQKFGSIAGVFDAEYESLLEVEGIGEQSATLLKLQALLCRMYMVDKQEVDQKIRLTPQNAGSYIVSHFYGYTKEVFKLFCLRADCSVICAETLSTGTMDSVAVYPREVIQKALDTKAVYVILAHNHPNGTMVASQSDIEMTKELEQALAFVQVRLIDHVIVSGNQYISLANHYHVFEKE